MLRNYISTYFLEQLTKNFIDKKPTSLYRQHQFPEEIEVTPAREYEMKQPKHRHRKLSFQQNFLAEKQSHQSHSNEHLHEHHEEEKEKTVFDRLKTHHGGVSIWQKVGAAGCLFLVAMFGCCMALTNSSVKLGCLSKFVSCIRFYVAGIFFGVAVFHLLPEALQLEEHLKFGFWINNHFYGLSTLFAFIGFVIMLFFDQTLAKNSDSQKLHENSILSVNIPINNVDIKLDQNINSNAMYSEHQKITYNQQSGHISDTSVHITNQHNTTPVPQNIIYGQKVFQDNNTSKQGLDNRSATTSICDNNCLVDHEDKENKQQRAIEHPVDFKNYYARISLLLALFLITVHCIQEGVIIATLSTTSLLWICTLIVSGHKWAVGFGVVILFVEKKASKIATIATMLIFSSSTPIALLIGAIIFNGESAVFCVFNSLTAGSLLYIGCQLIFHKSDDSDIRRSIFKFLLFNVGAIFIFTLSLFDFAH